MEDTCRNWVCNNYGKPGCVGREPLDGGYL